MKEFEQRSYSFEIRAEEDGNTGTITGRPIVYEKETDMHFFREIIERGALDKTDLRDVRFLVNHDISKIPLARSRNNNGNSTMHLTVDDEGMAIRVNLDIENNSEARSLYSAVKRGDISGMSFKFTIDGEKWNDLETDSPIRTVTEIGKVIEVSACTFPAYEQTSIQARDKMALEEARATIEAVKQDNDMLELEKEKAKALLTI